MERRGGIARIRGHVQLVALASVAKIGAAPDFRPWRLAPRPPLQCFKAALDIAAPQSAGGVVVHRVRHQHPQRRKSARVFGHDHRVDAELARDLARVQAARAAKSDQREIARVVAALDRDNANRALHVCVGDAQDSRRGGRAIELELACDAVHGRSGADDVDGHRAAEQLPRVDAPQHYVRVGDRGLHADSIAGAPWIGAGALRTHAQQSAGVHARNGASARAHGVNIEHRDADRQAVHHSLGGFTRRSVGQAHIGGSASHVEAQYAPEAAVAGGFERTHDASSRTREHRAHGMPRRFARRKKPAVGLHDRDAITAGARQFVEIGLHQRTDVGVHESGRAALVLAKLRADLVRAAQVHVFAAQRGHGRALICGVLVGVQKTDRDRSHAGAAELGGQPFQPGRRWAERDRAVMIGALPHSEAQGALS